MNKHTFISSIFLVVFCTIHGYSLSINNNILQPTDNDIQPYNFGYNFEDESGNGQWREEKSDPETKSVTGMYGYRDRNGIYREVYYIADANGFRVRMKTSEPSMVSRNTGDIEIVADPVPISLENQKTQQPSNNQNSIGNNLNTSGSMSIIHSKHLNNNLNTNTNNNVIPNASSNKAKNTQYSDDITNYIRSISV